MWSAAIVQLMVQAFKETISARPPETAWHDIFYNNIQHLSVHNTMYKYSIFIYMTLGVSLVWLLYSIVYPSDLKAILRMNERKMKSYTKFKEGLKGKEEPLMEK